MSEIFNRDDPLLRYESAKHRNRENRGRRAGVYVSYNSVGQGVVEFGKRVAFGVIYIEKPWMAYGCEIDMDSVRDALSLDGDDTVPFLPSSSGYVTNWDQDDKGNYIGAWVAIAVNYPPGIPVDAQVAIGHFFTFEAVALKDVPIDPETL